MNILINGCSGFLGSSACQRFLNDKKNIVVGIDKQSPTTVLKFSKNLGNFYFVNCDIEQLDFDELRNLLYSVGLKDFVPDILFHLTSPCSVLEFEKSVDSSINSSIVQLQNVISICKRWNYDTKIILPSSGNVYGNLMPPFRESMKPKPTNLYGFTKYTMESLLRNNYSNYVIFRIFLGYGLFEMNKGELQSIVYNFVKNMMRNHRPIVWGNGRQIRDFVYIDTIADAFEQCFNEDICNDVFNLCTNEGHTFHRVIEIINEALNTNLLPIYDNKPSFYIDRAYGDNSKLKSYFDLHIIPLQDGVSKLISFFKDHPELL